MEPIRAPLKLSTEAYWELVDLVSGTARAKPGDRASDRRHQLNTVYCCSVLNKSLREYVALEGWTDNDSWSVISNALNAVTDPAGDMLALRTLLALDGAGQYPDSRRIDGITNRTIGEVRNEAGLEEDRAFETYANLRKHYVARMYLRSASTLNPRGTTGASGRETKYPLSNIVRTFAEIISDAFARVDFQTVIASNIAAQLEQYANDSDGLLELPSSLLSALAMHACRQTLPSLTTLPPYYPNTVDLSFLASFLRIQQLPLNWNDPRSRSTPIFAKLRQRNRAISVSEILRNRRAILLGDPGQGKSTALAEIVASSINSGRPALLVRLPFLVLWLDKKHLPDRRTIVEAVARHALSVAGYGASDAHLSALVETMMTSTDFVLAIDGLDEVQDRDLRVLSSGLISEIARVMPGHLIISSRVTGYFPPFEAAEYILADLDTEADAPEIARTWFGGMDNTGLSRALDAIRSGAPAHIPMMVGFICNVAETEIVETTMYGLYGQYVSLLVAKVWKHPTSQLSADEVANKVRLARDLAWCMATGIDLSGRSPRRAPEDLPAEWTSTATMQYAQNVLGAEGVLELFGSDGLLVLHGPPALNPFASEFRWVHRTVHEYLVSSYIVEMRFTELQEHTSMIVMAIQNFNSWIFSLKNALSALPPKSQSLIVTAALTALRAGDPGRIIGTNLAFLMRGILHDSVERGDVWELLMGAGDLRDAYFLDRQRTIGHLLESDSPLRRAPFNLSRLFSQTQPPNEMYGILDTLLEAKDWRDAIDYWVPSILSYGLSSPTSEILSYLARALRQGIPWLQLPPSIDFTPDPVLLRELSSAVAGATNDVRPKGIMVLLMMSVDLKTEVHPSGPLDPDEVALALQRCRLEGWDVRTHNPLQFVKPSLVREAICGAHGASCAYLFGKFYPVETMELAHRDPWAEVGALTRAFDDFYSSKLWPAWAGALPTKSSARETIRSFKSIWAEDGADTVRIFRALAAFSLSPSDLNAGEYVEFFRRATHNGTGLPEPRYFEFFRGYSLDNSGLTLPEHLEHSILFCPALGTLLMQIDQDEMFHLILSSDPAGWCPEQSLTTYDLFFKRGIEPSMEIFLPVVEWTAQLGISPYLGLKRSLPLPSWAEKFLDRLFNDPGRYGLGSRGAIDDLAEWLANGGVLSRFRPKLLELLASEVSQP